MIIAGAGIGSTTTLLGRISHLVRCRVDPRIIGFPRLVADLRPARNIDFPKVVYDLRSARAAIEVLREAQARTMSAASCAIRRLPRPSTRRGPTSSCKQCV